MLPTRDDQAWMPGWWVPGTYTVALEMITGWAPLSVYIKQAVQEAVATCPRPLQLDLCPFDLESGVRVTCDVGFPSHP